MRCCTIGAGIEEGESGTLQIRGVGCTPRSRRPAAAWTWATPARCCACCPGWLAGQPGREWTLDGDESIRRRPVDRVVEPLARWARGSRRATTACRR